MRSSLPMRVLLISLILLVIPLFISAFFEFRAGFLDALKDAKVVMIEQANEKVLQMSHFSRARTAFLPEMAYLLRIEEILPTLPSKETNTLFKHLVSLGNLWGLSLYKITEDHKFINVASDDPYYVGTDYTNFFLYRDTLNKKYDNFLVYDKRPPHEKLLTADIVIDSKKTNQPIAVLAASFPATIQIKDILSPVRVPFKLKFAILTAKKIVFAASDPYLEMQYFQPLTNEEKQIIQDSGVFAYLPLPSQPIPSDPVPKSGFFQFILYNEPHIGYILNLQGTDRSFLTYTNLSVAFKAPRMKFLFIYSSYIIILLVGGAIVTLLTFRMSKPFAQLSNVMTSVKMQNLQARYQEDSLGFEINYLGQIFNDMIDSLLENMKRAQEEHVQREILEQEFKIGREVQMQILPQQMPTYPNVDLAEVFMPAKEVGGDFYDVFTYESPTEQRLILSVADTSGKGISACLYSLGVRSLLRGFGKEFSDLNHIVTQTNRIFYEEASDVGMFVTLFIASYDYRSHLLHYSCCGHNPPIILRANGKIDILENYGIALGVRLFSSSEEKTIQLFKGDILLLYTDGVTEAHNPQKELFGIKRLIDFLRKKPGTSPKVLIDELVKEIEAFSHPSPQHDDITLVAMRVLD